jgi:DNA-binding response OmpR family regulator
MKILITGLEPTLYNALKKGLEHFGIDLEVSGDGITSYDMVCANHYDLIVLDYDVAGVNLEKIIQAAKTQEQKTKILILLDKEMADEVEPSIKDNADEILFKPFDYGELVAKIRLLTKEEIKKDPTILESSGVRIDLTTKRVYVGTYERITLTPKEYRILEYLVKNAGVIVSAEDIVNYVWGERADYSSVSVKVHISKMRKKVADALNKDPLLTVRGGGYMFMQGL